MNKLLIACALLLLFFSAYSQPFPTGLVMDDEDYEAQAFTSNNIQFEGSKALERQVDLSDYCPEIRHQGDISSCVGWSIGYGALTIERAIANNWTDKAKITENANSALFVYNQVQKRDCRRGIVISQALERLLETGDCLAREYDFDPNDCTREITPNLFESARRYQISDYVALFELDAQPDKKIEMTKRVLSQRKPVVIGMRILENFAKIPEGRNSWWPNVGSDVPLGGHAMVVVGFDDDKFRSLEGDPNMTGAFKIMNSWGKNWGEEGYIWVRYAHFTEYCRYGFALILQDGDPIDLSDEANLLAQDDPTSTNTTTAAATGETRNLRQLSGSFGFRKYTDWYNGGPVFEEAPVKLQPSGYYTLADKSKIGDRFQLYVKSGFDNGYIYVFSVDEMEKVAVHFPKEHLDNNSKSRESALVMSGGAALTIPPGKNRVLKLRHPGEDYLVVLFSTEKFDTDIQKFAEKLLENRDNLVNSVQGKLSEWMVTRTDITYSRSGMGFEVSTRNKGKIVPLILKVNVSE